MTTLITPGIGAPATYTPPPAPGVGTIAGLGSIFFDLHQSGALGGMWSVLRNAGGPPGFPPGGTTNPDGSLSATQAGQFILPPNHANPTNPWPSLWQGTWTPSTYTPRSVTFTSAPAAAAGTSHSSILIQFGPDPENNPQYVGKFVGGIFGSTGQIPVVPAPWSLATFTLAGALARRRRAT